jgi:ribose transport system ATP-binding protein
MSIQGVEVDGGGAGNHATPALEVSGIQKVYGGEVALANATLRVDQGEIHGLLGANGAGKSTLVRIISGVERQDGGTVSLGGDPLPVPHNAAIARAHGLAMIHQDRALVADLSIAENVALTVGFPRRGRLVDGKALRRQAKDALARVGLDHDVDSFVRELPIADQTLVAIARALAIEAKIIILDEPTANLGAKDSNRLYERMSALAKEGVACVLITHALGEALRVCDRITVLRDGNIVASRPCHELTEQEVTTLVVGHKMPDYHSNGSAAADRSGTTPVLSLRDAHCDLLGPLSLDLRPGEVVGLTGLADSGHLLIGELLTGQRPLDDGEMTLGGEQFRPAGPAAAREHGVACVPPDRLRDGLAVQMSARENLFFDGRAVGSSFGIPRRRESAVAGEMLAAARVRPPGPEAILSTLSGGNMQKVLMAKWLAVKPQVLVLCEPTVGVDVGAREEIYERLREARELGLAIVLASSDFEEVLALSDHVFVIRYGQVIADEPAAQSSIERLTALSSG